MSNHTASGYLIVKGQTRRFGHSGDAYVTGLGLPRFVKNKPNLDADEVAVKLNVTIPDSVFLEPEFEASLELAEQDVIQPEVTVEARDPNE